MTTFIINLPCTLPAAGTTCEGVVTEDGRTVTRHIEASAALLPAPSAMEIVALVPASQLSWHRLELPRGALKGGAFQEGSTARLRTILDGLLEDLVLDETSQLHFAIEPKPRAGEPVWVAACDRTWLNAWLAALEQAGRPVARIVPELTPIAANPPGNASLHVTGNADHAQLLRAGTDGAAVLPLSATTAALLAWPEGAEVVAEPAVAALAEHTFKRAVTLQTAPERWLAAAQSGWDLAQFDLLHTRRTRIQKRLSAIVSTGLQAPDWRATRWAALALVAVNLVGLQAWAWKEQSALASKRNAIQSALTATFPEVRVVVDAPVQMARALADLQRRNGTASTADLETMLGKIQALAPELQTPSAIEFVAGELRLKGLDPAAAGLAGISARLQAQGYSARLEAGSLVMKDERRP